MNTSQLSSSSAGEDPSQQHGQMLFLPMSAIQSGGSPFDAAQRVPSKFVQAKEATQELSVCRKTLNRWAADGRIKVRRSGPRGRYLYDVDRFKFEEAQREYARRENPEAMMDTATGFPVQVLNQSGGSNSHASAPAPAASSRSTLNAEGSVIASKVIYIRVSSGRQREELDALKERLQMKYPDHEVIADIGTGINYFRRAGLRKLLDGCMDKKVTHVVVPNKYTLGRFTLHLFQWLFEKLGVEFTIDPETRREIDTDYAEDLLAVAQVMSSRDRKILPMMRAMGEAAGLHDATDGLEAEYDSSSRKRGRSDDDSDNDDDAIDGGYGEDQEDEEMPSRKRSRNA